VRNSADNCCPANIEKHLPKKGNDGRAYRGRKNTHGRSSSCGVGLPPEVAITFVAAASGSLDRRPPSKLSNSDATGERT
jgi:hypothetical protein